MKNTYPSIRDTPSGFLKRLFAVAAFAAFCGILGTPLHSRAQTVIPFGSTWWLCVSKVTNILTAQLTLTQRQTLQAKNFNELPLAARAVYLPSLAYAISAMVASNGRLLTAAELTAHLQTVSLIYEAPAIPPELSTLAAARLAIVNQALKELNVGIADQVAYSPSLQQAMYAGAVCGFTDWWDWIW
jgi:hypothetical protein